MGEALAPVLIYIDADERAALEAKATEALRSLSAEGRLALRAWLKS